MFINLSSFWWTTARQSSLFARDTAGTLGGTTTRGSRFGGCLGFAGSRQFDTEFAFQFANDLWIGDRFSRFVFRYDLRFLIDRRGQFLLRQLFGSTSL